MPSINANSLIGLQALQGMVLGMGVVWGILALLMLLCCLQLAAWGVSLLNRLLWVQWVLRLVLLIKSAPLMFYSGLMAVGYWTQPAEKLQASRTADGDWHYFVVGMIHLAFIPSAVIFVLSLIWIVRRLAGEAMRRSGGSAMPDKPLT